MCSPRVKWHSYTLRFATQGAGALKGCPFGRSLRSLAILQNSSWSQRARVKGLGAKWDQNLSMMSLCFFGQSPTARHGAIGGADLSACMPLGDSEMAAGAF